MAELDAMHPKMRETVVQSRVEDQDALAAIVRCEAAGGSYGTLRSDELRRASYFAKQSGDHIRVQRIAQELTRRRIA